MEPTAAAAIINNKLPEALEALYPTSTCKHGWGDGSASDPNAGAWMCDFPHNPRPYWAEYLRSARFSDVEKGLLYRPDITLGLLKDIENCFGRRDTGIMVQGSQGIGKSHTLVNLSILLESCPKYHVTFLPDCKKWHGIGDFAKAVFASFGIALEIEKAFTINSVMANADATILPLGIIDDMLKQRNIKWIFMFDEVNALFARQEYNQIKDVHSLPFPYNLMGRVAKEKRIFSIICASSNNEISHCDGHEGYKDFYHHIKLNMNEANI